MEQINSSGGLMYGVRGADHFFYAWSGAEMRFAVTKTLRKGTITFLASSEDPAGVRRSLGPMRAVGLATRMYLMRSYYEHD